MRNAILTTFVLALLVAPFALAEETSSYRYAWYGAGATSAKGGCSSFSDPLSDGPFPVVHGGPCDITVEPGQTVTAVAVDDVKGSNVQIRAYFYNVESNVVQPIPDAPYYVDAQTQIDCAPVAYGTGTLSVVVPEGCRHATIRMGWGATTGTLTISVA